MGLGLGQAFAMTTYADPDEVNIRYWVVGSLPTAWVIETDGEADSTLAGTFMTMRLTKRTSSQISASCIWYEPTGAGQFKRTAFTVTKTSADPLWSTYKSNFSQLSNKPRWLQSLGAMCMFQKGGEVVTQVRAQATGVRLKELPGFVVRPVMQGGVRTFAVFKASTAK